MYIINPSLIQEIFMSNPMLIIIKLDYTCSTKHILNSTLKYVYTTETINNSLLYDLLKHSHEPIRNSFCKVSL